MKCRKPAGLAIFVGLLGEGDREGQKATAARFSSAGYPVRGVRVPRSSRPDCRW